MQKLHKYNDFNVNINSNNAKGYNYKKKISGETRIYSTFFLRKNAKLCADNFLYMQNVSHP